MRITDHPLYYSVHTRLRAFHIRRLLSSVRQREVFCDVGCGLGYWLESEGKDYPLSVGLDNDQEGLHVNKRRGLKVMVQCIVNDIPLRDNCVDLVICSEVLEHLPDTLDQESLIEMTRVLKTGGRMIITVPALEGINARSKMRNLGHDDPSGGEYHYRMGYTKEMLLEYIHSIPTLTVSQHKYSMFLFSELFMDLQKWVFYRTNKLKEHSDIMNAQNSLFFRVYKFFFPILHLFFLLEDIILCPLLKGHIHIIELEKV